MKKHIQNNRNKRGNPVESKKQRHSSGASRQVSKRHQSPASTSKVPRMGNRKLLGTADRSQLFATPKLSYRTDRPSPAPERYIPPVVPARKPDGKIELDKTGANSDAIDRRTK